MDWPCVRDHPEGAVLRVRVTPRAPRTGAAGIVQDRLHVRVHAAPADDRANHALMAWLARTLDVAPSRVALLRGGRSRQKDLLIRGVGAAALGDRLAACLGGPGGSVSS